MEDLADELLDSGDIEDLAEDLMFYGGFDEDESIEEAESQLLDELLN